MNVYGFCWVQVGTLFSLFDGSSATIRAMFEPYFLGNSTNDWWKLQCKQSTFSIPSLFCLIWYSCNDNRVSAGLKESYMPLHELRSLWGVKSKQKVLNSQSHCIKCCIIYSAIYKYWDNQDKIMFAVESINL